MKKIKVADLETTVLDEEEQKVYPSYVMDYVVNRFEKFRCFSSPSPFGGSVDGKELLEILEGLPPSPIPSYFMGVFYPLMDKLTEHDPNFFEMYFLNARLLYLCNIGSHRPLIREVLEDPNEKNKEEVEDTIDIHKTTRSYLQTALKYYEEFREDKDPQLAYYSNQIKSLIQDVYIKEIELSKALGVKHKDRKSALGMAIKLRNLVSLSDELFDGVFLDRKFAVAATLGYAHAFKYRGIGEEHERGERYFKLAAETIGMHWEILEGLKHYAELKR